MDWKKVVRWALKAVLVAAALVLLYHLAHNLATEQRGYEAVGGEIFVFILPVIICLLVDSVKDTLETAKTFRDDNDED